MANEVFISYSSRKDLDLTVTKLHDALQTALQLRTNNETTIFFAPKTIQPGKNWESAIKNALSDAYVLIILLSSNWLNSRECIKEYSNFDKNSDKKRIIPLLWVDTNDRAAQGDKTKEEILKGLKKLQGIDWRQKKLDTDFHNSVYAKTNIEELANTIIEYLSGTETHAQPQITNSENPDESNTKKKDGDKNGENGKKSKRPYLITFFVCLILMAIAYWIIWGSTKQFAGIVFIDGKPPKSQLKITILDLNDSTFTDQRGRFSFKIDKEIKADRLAIEVTGSDSNFQKDTIVEFKEYDYYKFNSLQTFKVDSNTINSTQHLDTNGSLSKVQSNAGKIQERLKSLLEVNLQLHKTYVDNKRKGIFLKPIYANNKELFKIVDYLRSNRNYYSEDFLRSVDSLHDHLTNWITTYEKDSTNYKWDKYTTVEYQDLKYPFPTSIDAKLGVKQ